MEEDHNVKLLAVVFVNNIKRRPCRYPHYVAPLNIRRRLLLSQKSNNPSPCTQISHITAYTQHMHGSKNVITSANEEDGLCIVMVGSYKGVGIGLQEGDPIVIDSSEQLRLAAEPRRHPDSTILRPHPLLQTLLPKRIRVRPPFSSLLLLLIRVPPPSMEPLLTLLLADLHLFLRAVLSRALLLALLKPLPLVFLLLPTFAAAAALLLSVSLLAALLALLELGRVVLVLVLATGLAALELRVFLLVVTVHGGEHERKDEDGSEEEEGKGLCRCHRHFYVRSSS